MIVFATLDHAVPAGGIRVVYAMVEALNRGGVEAAVWHASKGFRATWFEHDVPVVSGLTRRLEVGDVLVMPEIGGARYQPLTRGAKVVMLNQAHFFTTSGAGVERPDSSGYPGWPNCEAVVVTSKAVERLVLALTGDRVPVLRVGLPVDDEFFVESDKERIIVALSGRRHDELVLLAHLLDRSNDLPDGWRFRVVGGLARAELGSLLARAAVFVSTADHDGFSLPGAEALAAGCDVVGFHGDGAREYMLPEFTTVVDDPDLVALRDAVVAAAREYDQDRETFLRRRAAGRDFVREHYAPEVFAERTVEVFAGLVRGGAGQQHPVTVTHMYAPPSRATRVRSLLGRLRRRLTRA